MRKYFVQIVHNTIYTGELEAEGVQDALARLNADRDYLGETNYTRVEEGTVYARAIGGSSPGYSEDFWDDDPEPVLPPATGAAAS